jgi:hypothetical protein
VIDVDAPSADVGGKTEGAPFASIGGETEMKNLILTIAAVIAAPLAAFAE